MDVVAAKLTEDTAVALSQSNRFLTSSIEMMEDLLGNRGENALTKFEETKIMALKNRLFVKLALNDYEGNIGDVFVFKKYRPLER